MAEAIAAAGLAASIVTFVDVSAKVLDRLHEFNSTAQEMPKAFRDIRKRLPLVRSVVKQINKGCEDGSLTENARHELSHIVQGCLEQITLLEELIEKMLPASTASTPRRFWKAITSVRKEKDISVIEETLGKYERTLTLYFSLRSEASTAIATKESTYYEVPSLQVSQFVGRVELLDKIEASFADATGDASRPKIVVLLGMGGQGKT